MDGTIYYIPFMENAWLYPSLIATGLAILCLTILIKWRWLVIPGFLLILAGGIVERDISVICGGLGCAFGIWLFYKP